MAKEGIVLGFLFVLAWQDVKKQELSLPLLAAFAAGGLMFQLLAKDLAWESVLGGVLVGGALLVCAVASKENIGVGDGLLFCATGIGLGFRENILLLFFASVCAAGVALLLVWRKKYSRRQRIPFAPFVLVADVFLLALT